MRERERERERGGGGGWVEEREKAELCTGFLLHIESSRFVVIYTQ